MINKKGLSTIVTTLILVLLVLVAVGILWNPIKNLLNDNTEAFDKTKCLTVDLKIKVTPDAVVVGDYDVTITRSDGGDEAVGVKLVFHNDTNNIVSDVLDFSGATSLGALETETVGISTLPVVEEAVLLEATPYFLNGDTNKEQLCTTIKVELG